MDMDYLYKINKTYITISKYDYVRRCTNILLQKIFEIVAKQPSLNSLRCCAFFAPVMYSIIRRHVVSCFKYSTHLTVCERMGHAELCHAEYGNGNKNDIHRHTNKLRQTQVNTHTHLRTYDRSKLSAHE